MRIMHQKLPAVNLFSPAQKYVRGQGGGILATEPARPYTGKTDPRDAAPA